MFAVIDGEALTKAVGGAVSLRWGWNDRTERLAAGAQQPPGAGEAAIWP